MALSSSSSSSQSSTVVVSSSTVAVGVDVGSGHARIATYDTNYERPVVCANHEGHRATKVLWSSNIEERPEQPVTSAESLKGFFNSKVLTLAESWAHTKDLSIVTSISNDRNENLPEGWLETLQSYGSVITEAAAVVLAYHVDPTRYRRVLVLDGGASAVKATILTHNGDGLWQQIHFAKLTTVNGPTLVEPLAKAVAQQFEQQHRFPRGEVWQSTKARRKLQFACEQCLGSFQRLQNVSIHVDGLYEGVDCNVRISKPKWEHLSSQQANQVKTFCQKELQAIPNEGTIDTVLIAGKLHDWMLPIVKSTMGMDKLHPTVGTFDPAEAIAMGCTLQSHWNLQQKLQDSNKDIMSSPHPTLQVPCCPVEIGLVAAGANGNGRGDNHSKILISKGTPLPCDVSHEMSSTESFELVQTLPNQKILAKLEDLSMPSTMIQLQLSLQGRLRIQVNGEESIVIG